MTEQNHDNTNVLSPEEKFIEIQKQDWQIEALIIGSIIIGLVQIPSLVDTYHLKIMDLFGLRTVCIETILNLPFAILLINLIIVLLVRAIWVIEAFGKKRVELMNDYNDLASSFFGNALHLFLLYLGGAIFWTTINIILPDNYVTFRIIQIISALIFYGFIGLMGIRFAIASNYFKLKVNDKWFFINWVFGISLLCPLYFLIYRSKFRSLSYDILENLNLQFSKKIPFFSTINALFYLIIAFYFFTLTSMIGFDINKESDSARINIQDPKSPIKIDSDCFEGNSLGIFIHSAIIDKKRENQEFDEGSILVSLKDQILKLDWVESINESGKGVKTYLNSKDFDPGFNRVTITTNRSGKSRKFNLMLFKPDK